MRKSAINIVWNTQVVQIFCEERDGKFIFKVNMIFRLPKPGELSYE